MLVHDAIDSKTDEVIATAGTEITELLAAAIQATDVEEVEVRSVLTCEQRKGTCAKCYGRNLATARLAQTGDAVGVIAAQSIGEPGTQLTLRTFHVGGTAANIADENDIKAKGDGKLEIDELRVVETTAASGDKEVIVVSRSSEMKIIDEKTGVTVATNNIPYGAKLLVHKKKKVKKGDVICTWDPYNSVIVSEAEGKVVFDNVESGITYREEVDEQTGFTEMVVIETKDKKKNPVINVEKGGEILRSYSLPVGSHISVQEGDKITLGDTIAKIPRVAGKSGDITGGLPRVTELFEARNPSNPAVVSEIDGIASFGKIKRGNREIIVESKTGEVKKYLCSLSKHILVQENDFVKAGMPLSDGAITPADILAIEGPTAVQEYLVNEIQEVYRLQGVKINDKHFEIIVRQMMRKVIIEDQGDTRFLEKQSVDKAEFMRENDLVYGMKVVIDAGEAEAIKPGQILSARKLRDENSKLKRKAMALIEARDVVPATSRPLLQGITRASLHTQSFISAASFQETTKVLNEAAVAGKVDYLAGLKENVIVGHQIPAGTGTRKFQKVIVGSQEEFDALTAKKEAEAAEE